MSALFDVLPWLGGLVVAVLAVMGYGRAKKREGRSERDLQDAKATNETHERMNDAQTSDGLSDVDIKRLLRERGKRDNGT